MVLTEKVDLNVDYIDNKLFEGVFELTEENINNHNHDNNNNKMTLMSDLESAFNITIDTDDIIDFSSFKKGIQILKKYKVN